MILNTLLNRKDTRYTEKDAAIVVRQMLKVAAECHLRGLVHRDMKPEVEDQTYSANSEVAFFVQVIHFFIAHVQ